MDGSNSKFVKSKTEDKYHINKLFGLQQSGSSDDYSEMMEDFKEKDTWVGVNDAETNQVGLQAKGCNFVSGCRSKKIKDENSNNTRRSVKILPKESCHEEGNGTRYQSSAPVNVPTWSQLQWKEKRKDNYWGSHGIVDANIDDDEDNGGRDFERIPPHEIIARQLAQSETTSFSVYEGIGRTLKGRDLSRVRNAILTKTGFIE